MLVQKLEDPFPVKTHRVRYLVITDPEEDVAMLERTLNPKCSRTVLPMLKGNPLPVYSYELRDTDLVMRTVLIVRVTVLAVSLLAAVRLGPSGNRGNPRQSNLSSRTSSC